MTRGGGGGGAGGGALGDLIEDVDSGDVEEGASREQHGYACQRQLNYIHHLCVNMTDKVLIIISYYP